MNGNIISAPSPIFPSMRYMGLDGPAPTCWAHAVRVVIFCESAGADLLFTLGTVCCARPDAPTRWASPHFT